MNHLHLLISNKLLVLLINSNLLVLFITFIVFNIGVTYLLRRLYIFLYFIGVILFKPSFCWDIKLT